MKPTLTRTVPVSFFAWLTIAAVVLALSASAAYGQLKPRITLLRVGTFSVIPGQRIEVGQRTVVVGGEALAAADLEVFALTRYRYDTKWTVVGSAVVSPGGVFEVSGIQLGGAGEYEFVVVLAAIDEFKLGNRLDEEVWRKRKQSVSEGITIVMTSLAAPTPPPIALLGIGTTAFVSNEVIPVPASGDVYISAPTGSYQIYLVVHVPYTDRAFIIGPASKEPSSNNFILPGVSLQVPGDSRQVRMDLIAVASRRALETGPVSWAAIQDWPMLRSATVEVRMDAREPVVDSIRVPSVAITRIGDVTFSDAVPASTSGQKPKVVRYGDAGFAEEQRGMQGSNKYFLTRLQGSSFWYCQGPAIPAGLPLGDTQRESQGVTLIWPSLRFERPAGAEEDPALFDVRLLSTPDVFPNGWIDTTFIPSRRIDTISTEVRIVQVVGLPQRSAPHLEILGVGNMDVGDGDIVVKAPAKVIVFVPKDFPATMNVFVGVKREGEKTWFFTETFATGETRQTPAIAFGTPDTPEGAGYEVIAISTNGPLPSRSMEYAQFQPYAASFSNTVTVRYSLGTLSALNQWLHSWFPGTAYAQSDVPSATPISSPAVVGGNSYGGFLLALVVLLIVLCAVGLILETKFGTLSRVLKWAAKTLNELRRDISNSFDETFDLQPARFLVGCVMLVVVLYVIDHYYIALLADVVQKVTALARREAKGLGLWIIVIVAFLGIAIDFTFTMWLKERQQNPARSRFHFSVFAVSLIAAFFLWCFEGGLYFSSFSVDAEGIVAPMGGLVFFLIGMAETIIFFIVSELTLPTAGVIAKALILAPIYILEVCCDGLSEALSTISSHRQTYYNPPPAGAVGD